MKTADYNNPPENMRDYFWKEVYLEAVRDTRIVVVTADMGAPALDVFKKQFPHRYINTGIAEQQAILTACGLAREGFIPFVYAIMPFITYRCYEQIKTVAGLMNIPINIVGVGSGFSYEESGPTHHSLEDIGIMAVVPHMTVLNCSSPAMAKQVGAHAVHHRDKLKYIRLDRQPMINPTSGVHDRITPEQFRDGFIVHRNVGGNGKVVVTTGNMIHTVIHNNDRLAVSAGIIEVFRFPYNPNALFGELSGVKDLYILEEHNGLNGLGSLVSHTVQGTGIKVHNRDINTHQGYTYIYGGREEIHRHYRMTRGDIDQWLQ